MTSSRKEEPQNLRPSIAENEETRPRELFRRIQKRDGTMVDFDREKITEAIWAAARSVGGTSRSTADLLADRVILYLARIYDDHLLTIEEVQDAVEKVLIEQGHAKTAKAYILYRDKRAQERAGRKGAADTPSIYGKSPISVQSSRHDRVRWDRKRIVEALLRETSIPRKFAEQISREIEQQIINGKMRSVTLSLIREMVNCKLIEHNLNTEWTSHTRLGLRLTEVEGFLRGGGEAAAYPASPLVSDAGIAGEINRQYAFLALYPEEVVEAHQAGDIYLHHADSVQSLHHGVHSLEYIKLFGIDFPRVPFREGPPQTAEDLCDRAALFSREVAEHYREGFSWPCFNVFAAPFFKDLPEDNAVLAIRSFFRNVAHFGRRSNSISPLYLDLCWETPALLKEQPAVGPGGSRENPTYAGYEKTSRDLFRLIQREYARGDGRGQPVQGAEVRIYLSRGVWEAGSESGPWEEIQNTIRENVALSFLLQRGNSLHFPECLPLSLAPDDSGDRDIRYPWKLRYGTWGKVSIHLPRIAAESGGQEKNLEEGLASVFQTASIAADSKRKYMEGLFHQGSRGPLSLLMARKDGEPYLRRTAYLLGLYGVHEAAAIFLGDPDASDQAHREVERKIVERLYILCRKYSRDQGMPLLLCQSWEPAAMDHFGRLDPKQNTPPNRTERKQLRLFAEDEGILSRLRTMEPGSRVERQALLHDFHEGGARVLLDADDLPEDVHGQCGFFHRLYRDTRALAIRIEANVTFCEDCGLRARGKHDLCPACQSSNVV
jgi:ribonucleoside-triphosphate reductase